MIVIKKDNTEQAFNIDKVIKAVKKSAERCMYTFTEDDLNQINNIVTSMAANYASEHDGKIPINMMHNFAETARDHIN